MKIPRKNQGFRRKVKSVRTPKQKRRDDALVELIRLANRQRKPRNVIPMFSDDDGGAA